MDLIAGFIIALILGWFAFASLIVSQEKDKDQDDDKE